MPNTSFRNRSIRQLSFAVVLCAVVAGLILIVWSIFIFVPPDSHLNGALLLATGLMLIALSIFLHIGVLIAIKAEGNINRIHNDTLDLLEVVHRIDPLIKALADNSQISDAARSIAHRERERETLRQAIREEMYSGDLEVAQYLIEEMQRRFGYKQEAKVLLEELAQVREMTIEEKINEAVSHIEEMMNKYQWERARQESERLMKLFPHHERVLTLPAALGQKREARKQDLLVQWKTAVARDEIDQGISILTELDPYLTPEEAKSLQESARDVFKTHLLNLGVQFGLAVSENQWTKALEIGLRIRQEFPNSRMAQEVGEKLDILRVRAGFVADTEVTKRTQGQTPPAG